MSEGLPTDLPERVARASQAQRAAIERFLAGGPLPEPRQAAAVSSPGQAAAGGEGNSLLVEMLACLGRIESKLDAVQEAQTQELKAEMRAVLAEAMKHAVAAQPPINQGEAQRIFAVLTKLRTETGVRKAPLHDVFEYMVMQGLSGEETARRCKCVPSLISARVRTLKERFGMPVSQLQHYASVLNEMETSVRGDKRRRKGAGPPDDFEGAGLEEDEGDESERGGDAGDGEGENDS
jgi:hypothetical protein